MPRVAWACAAVALLNGLAWSLITPPFQVPDENAHYAYVQQLAERGKLPRAGGAGRLLLAGRGRHAGRDRLLPDRRPAAQSRAVLHAPAAGGRRRRTPCTCGRTGSGSAFTATNNPPLFYAIQTVPYKLAGAAGGSVLDRLAAMRIVSVLMAALTVLLVYLFLSELLPGSPLACCAGTLVAALQPLFALHVLGREQRRAAVSRRRPVCCGASRGSSNEA